MVKVFVTWVRSVVILFATYVPCFLSIAYFVRAHNISGHDECLGIFLDFPLFVLLLLGRILGLLQRILLLFIPIKDLRRYFAILPLFLSLGDRAEFLIEGKHHVEGLHVYQIAH